MEVLSLTATRFIRPMSVGRTGALLLGCEDSAGKYHEVVVKLRGREMTAKSQIAELVSAQLADALGLEVPVPAIVAVPAGFEAVVLHPVAAAAVKASPGANFGSVHLGAGFTGWPEDRPLIGPMRETAASIFAFDALVQNPDRRAQAPTTNLWARSDTIGVFDHEQTFAFLYTTLLGDPPRPWVVADQAAGFDFLKQHVFYTALKGRPLALDGFESRLGKLGKAKVANCLKQVPKDWRSGHDLCEKIADYLAEARKERARLIAFLNHILR